MLLPVWIALGVAAAVVVASSAYALTRGLAAWRSLRRLRRKLSAGVAELERRAERTERAVGSSAEAAARLRHARAELDRTLAGARVLASAFAEVRAAVGRVTGLVPGK